MSICLVMHELPQQASQAIVQEAFRILRPGGTFAIMVISSCARPSQCSNLVLTRLEGFAILARRGSLSSREYQASSALPPSELLTDQILCIL